MTRLVLTALLIALGLPVRAAEGQLVPASQLVAAAQTLLEGKVSSEKIPATFALVGHVSDLTSPAAVAELQADMKGPWLRPRVGVPVRVKFADGKTTSVTVWFSVTAPAQADVYETAYPRGTAAVAIQTHVGAVDLARVHGALGVVAKPAGIGDAAAKVAGTDASANASVGDASAQPASLRLRLRHAVLANAAVQTEDFEPMPAVQAQQDIRIDVGAGIVHLSTKGKALTDGAIGQTIAVLPANATQPVRARVVSDQVVTIEN
jgi:hypothetical protein